MTVHRITNASKVINSHLSSQKSLTASWLQSTTNMLRQPRRLLATALVLVSSLVAVNAQAATVSVSNHPLFLLSQAVTEGAPPAKQLLQAGRWDITAVLAQAILKPFKTVSLWCGSVRH